MFSNLILIFCLCGGFAQRLFTFLKLKKESKLEKTDFGYDSKIIPSLFLLADLPFRIARKYFYGWENRNSPRLSVIADNFFASFRGSSWLRPRPDMLQQTTNIGFRVGKSFNRCPSWRLFTASPSLSELLKEKPFERSTGLSADRTLKRFFEFYLTARKDYLYSLSIANP